MAPRHILPFVVPLALITMGTTGYSLVENWSITDSLYMTVITLSTVGFAEVHPLSEQGRAFTVILVLGGVFTFFYVASEAMRSIFGGEIQKLLGRQRLEKSLANLEGHLVVVFGNSVTAAHVAKGRVRSDRRVALVGTTHDPQPLEAGIGRAAGVLACSSTGNLPIAPTVRARIEENFQG